MGVLSFLQGAGGAISGLLGGVTGLLDKVTTTDEERLKVQLEMEKLKSAFQLEMAKLDVEHAKTQASVITAEVHSKSWMASNWRPLLMLTFTFLIAWNYFMAPVFGQPMAEIPPQMWQLIELGLGGYVAGRTLEKVAPVLAHAVVNKKGKS